MMKIFTITIFLFLASCGQNESKTVSSNDSAGTPLSTACLNGTAHCNSSLYAQYPGYYPAYPGANRWVHGQYQWCGCQGGSFPVYHGQMGSGCIASHFVQPYVNFGFYFSIGHNYGVLPYGGHPGSAWMGPSYAPNNQHPVSIPQYSSVAGFGGSGGNCQRNALLACYVDQPNSCAGGYTCRVTAAASRLGVCTR